MVGRGPMEARVTMAGVGTHGREGTHGGQDTREGQGDHCRAPAAGHPRRGVRAGGVRSPGPAGCFRADAGPCPAGILPLPAATGTPRLSPPCRRGQPGRRTAAGCLSLSPASLRCPGLRPAVSGTERAPGRGCRCRCRRFRPVSRQLPVTRSPLQPPSLSPSPAGLAVTVPDPIAPASPLLAPPWPPAAGPRRCRGRCRCPGPPRCPLTAPSSGSSPSLPSSVSRSMSNTPAMTPRHRDPGGTRPAGHAPSCDSAPAGHAPPAGPAPSPPLATPLRVTGGKPGIPAAGHAGSCSAENPGAGVSR